MDLFGLILVIILVVLIFRSLLRPKIRPSTLVRVIVIDLWIVVGLSYGLMGVSYIVCGPEGACPGTLGKGGDYAFMAVLVLLGLAATLLVGAAVRSIIRRLRDKRRLSGIQAG